MTPYYDDQGVEVHVTRGLGDWWIVARGRHRVKSPAMPPRKTAIECQCDLDEYARKKGWRAVSICDLHGPAKRSQ